jgi:hypothetical protein
VLSVRALAYSQVTPTMGAIFRYESRAWMQLAVGMAGLLNASQAVVFPPDFSMILRQHEPAAAQAPLPLPLPPADRVKYAAMPAPASATTMPPTKRSPKQPTSKKTQVLLFFGGCGGNGPGGPP